MFSFPKFLVLLSGVLAVQGAKKVKVAKGIAKPTTGVSQLPAKYLLYVGGRSLLPIRLYFNMVHSIMLSVGSLCRTFLAINSSTWTVRIPIPSVPHLISWISFSFSSIES